MKHSFVVAVWSAFVATSVIAAERTAEDWEDLREYFSEDWQEVGDGTMLIKERNRWFMRDGEETSFVDVLCEHRSLQSNGQMIVVPETVYDRLPPDSLGREIIDITCN